MVHKPHHRYHDDEPLIQKGARCSHRLRGSRAKTFRRVSERDDPLTLISSSSNELLSALPLPRSFLGMALDIVCRVLRFGLFNEQEGDQAVCF